MRYRPLGNTGIAVSEIGFGTWGIGGVTSGATSYGPQDDKASLAALDAALDSGINFFDTSNCYGDGHSETLLGTAFRGRRDRAIIASKAGREDYIWTASSPAHIRNSLDGTLARLGTDYLDVLQLHGPTLEDLRLNPGIIGVLGELKSEGRIRAYGISVNSPEEGIEAVNEFDFPVVQVNLNLVDQRAIQCGLIDLAATKKVGLIVRTPLCFGFLSGKMDTDVSFPETDHRSRWSPAQIGTWIAASSMFVESLESRDRQTKAQIALRFCLSFGPVSAVIPGILSADEARENASASPLGPLTDSEIETICQIYEGKEFFVRE